MITTKLIKPGNGRWVRAKCPECGNICLIRTFVNDLNKAEVECRECKAVFDAEWNEEDEKME